MRETIPTMDGFLAGSTLLHFAKRTGIGTSLWTVGRTATFAATVFFLERGRLRAACSGSGARGGAGLNSACWSKYFFRRKRAEAVFRISDHRDEGRASR